VIVPASDISRNFISVLVDPKTALLKAALRRTGLVVFDGDFRDASVAVEFDRYPFDRFHGFSFEGELARKREKRQAVRRIKDLQTSCNFF
jgi:hypothetical protein